MGEKIKKTINSLIWIMLITLIIIFAADRVSTYYLPDINIVDIYNINQFVIPKPFLYYAGRPNLDMGKEALNPLGYRGKIPPPEKGPDEYRIFILGGSTVFCGNPPIPDLVERFLLRDLPATKKASVYNFGVLGQNSGMELARVVFEISDFKPDMIIMYSGANDVYSPVFADPRPGYPGNFMIRENNPLQKDAESYPSITMFLWGSNLFRYLISKNNTILDYYKEKLLSFSRLRLENHYLSDKWIDAIAETYCANIEKTAIISDVYGAKFLGFFQPMLFYKDYLDFEEQACIEQYSRQEIDYHIHVREKIRRLFEQMNDKGISVYDLSDIYDSTPESVFVDFCHTKQKYKNVVAAEISRQAARQMKAIKPDDEKS